MARKPDYFSSGEKLTSSRLNDILRYMFSITPKGDGKTVKVTQTPSGTTISAGHKSSTAMSKKTESILIKVKVNSEQTLTDQYFCDVYENGAEEDPTILNQKAFAVPSFILTEDTFFFSNSKIDDVYYFTAPPQEPKPESKIIKLQEKLSEDECSAYEINNPYQLFIVRIIKDSDFEFIIDTDRQYIAKKIKWIETLENDKTVENTTYAIEVEKPIVLTSGNALIIKIKDGNVCDLYENGKTSAATEINVPFRDLNDVDGFYDDISFYKDTFMLGFRIFNILEQNENTVQPVYINLPRWV